MKKLTLIKIAALIQGILFCNLAFAQEIPFSFHPTYSHEGNRNWIIEELPSQSQYTDFITIKNDTAENLPLTLSFHEAKDTKDGFQIEESKNFQNIGNWVNLPTSEINLYPNEERKIQLKTLIPENTKNGKYTGVILASYKNQADQLNIVTRVGIRYYLTVNNNADFRTSIIQIDLNDAQKILIITTFFTTLLGLFYLAKTKYEKNNS